MLAVAASESLLQFQEGPQPTQVHYKGAQGATQLPLQLRENRNAERRDADAS